MNTIVIVPSYEPDEKMVNTVKKMIDSGFNEIVVVDDGGSDKCQKYFSEVSVLPQVTLLVHEFNKGKGRAMKTAFEYVLYNRSDAAGVVTVDADGQHLPEDIMRCVLEMESRKDDIVLGVRDFSKDDVPARSKFGNELTRAVFKLCKVNVTDTQTGLRAFPMKYVKAMLEVEGERYEYETEQLLEINNLGIHIHEEIIETVYIDDNESSHFNPIKDSIKIYKVIFRYMYRKNKRLVKCVAGVAAAAFAVITVFGKLFSHKKS